MIPGAQWSGTGEGTAHLAKPWMPEAPRDRHCSRSLSTVASTVSMLGSGSLGSWMREVKWVSCLAGQVTSWVPPIHSPGLVCPGVLRWQLHWLLPGWFVLCWQCVLLPGVVAKGQWLWRLGGAPAVTLTVPNGRARRDRAVLSLAAPSTHCAARSPPCNAQAWDSQAQTRVGVFRSLSDHSEDQATGLQGPPCPGWREAQGPIPM